MQWHVDDQEAMLETRKQVPHMFFEDVAEREMADCVLRSRETV